MDIFNHNHHHHHRHITHSIITAQYHVGRLHDGIFKADTREFTEGLDILRW